MAHRILVLENDAEFLSELRMGLFRFDVEIENVPDGMRGVERAMAFRPDLILLSIEVKPNGFLVCKNLKKDPDLAGIPLMILSSDPNADEIFEQHQKLRTRADVYVKKPVSMATLQREIAKFVTLREAPAPESTQIQDRTSIDAEIDAFADEAFDNFMGSAAPVKSVPPPKRAPVKESFDDAMLLSEAPVVLSDAPSIPILAEDDSLPPLRVPAAPLPRVASVAQAPARDVAKSSSDDLEHLRSALVASRDRVDELEREASRSKRPSSGAPSREYLDLREKLNAKERELTTKEREVIGLRDEISSREERALQFERQIADLTDKRQELEDEIASQKKKLDMLSADRELMRKRDTDTRAALQTAEAEGARLTQALEAVQAELSAHKTSSEEERQSHAAKLRKTEAEHSAAVAEVKSAAETARATLTEQHSKQVASFEADMDALRGQIADAESRRRSEVAALQQKLEAELSRLTEEHDTRQARLRAEHAASLELAVEDTTKRLRAEGEAERLRAVTEAETALREALTTEKDRAISDAQTAHGKELAVLGRKLTETEVRLSKAEGGLASAERELTEVRTSSERQIASLRERVSRDSEVLTRVRRAMSIGLGLLEENSPSE